MATRRSIVLDRETEKLLDKLAAERSGNGSAVVREALKTYADVEDRLDEIENDPAFQEMIKKSDADIKAGRVIPHEEVVRGIRARHKRRKKQ